MVYEVYSMYDEKAQAFAQPFFAQRREVAFRMIKSAVMDGTNDIARYISDYVLYRVGTWDDALGEMQVDKENLGYVASLIDMEGTKEL